MLALRFITVVITATLAVAPVLAASASPGKSSAFVSAKDVTIVTGFIPVASATIVKGKKRRVLAIEAMLTTPEFPIFPVIGVRVNGIQPEPDSTASGWCPDHHCTVTGTWWLDLDAAEAQSPGVFVGQPLLVELMAGNGGGGEPTANVSLTVRMEKR